ncbi:ATP-dependent RNA helicase [Blastocladiella emersonii ATCC 22665]|nr:ATP-dependent RNA helicase [Blastocladiella emersonii ATCC 22665]
MDLHPALFERLSAQKLAEPTFIQSASYKLLSSADAPRVALAAETGSGKTLAYLLPLLDRLLHNEKRTGIAALVLVPTADLARQVAGVVALYGTPQIAPLTHILDSPSSPTSILVTTPAALNALPKPDVMRRLADLDALVIDEADHLLSGGYQAATLDIIAAFRKSRGTQIILAGATMSDRSAKWPLALARRALPDLTLVESPRNHCTVPTLNEEFIRAGPESDVDGRHVAVLSAIDAAATDAAHPADIVLVFTRKSDTVPALATALRNDRPAWTVHAFSRHTDPDDRATLLANLRSTRRARSESPTVVVCTDALARGVDLPRVTHVVHHTFPSDATTYLHRVGRTARAGKRGVSIALVGPKDERLAVALERTARGVKVGHASDVVLSAGEKDAVAEVGGKASVEALFSRNRSWRVQYRKAVKSQQGSERE